MLDAQTTANASQGGEACQADRSQGAGFGDSGKSPQVFATDIDDEDRVVEVAIGGFVKFPLTIGTAAIHILEAHHQVVAQHIGDGMLEAIGIFRGLGAKDIGIIASIQAITAQVEVEFATSLDDAVADKIPEVEGVAPDVIATAKGSGASRTVGIGGAAGNIAEDQSRSVGGAGCRVGELVAVASPFVDEVGFDLVVRNNIQVREVELFEAEEVELEALPRHELLIEGMVEGHRAGALALDRGLGPGVVPGEGVCNLRMGHDRSRDGEDRSQQCFVHENMVRLA